MNDKNFMKCNDILVVKSKELFYKYYYDNDCLIINKKIISTKLLVDLLKNKFLFKYVLDNIKKNKNVIVDIRCNDDTLSNITIRRKELLEFYSIINSNLLNVSSLQNLKIISNLLSINSLISYYNDYLYSVIIDGNNYSIEANILINILLLSEDEFNLFLNGIKKYKFSNIEMINILNSFIRDEDIQNKYFLDKKIIDKINILNTYENKSEKKSIKNYNIILDSSLESEVNKDVDIIYSPLESFLIIYRNLVNILNIKPSKDIKNIGVLIDNIKDKNKDNNNISENEFILMLTYFLDRLNINYDLDIETLINNRAYLSPLTIYYAEYNFAIIINSNLKPKDFEGIKVLNKNKTTIIKFNELLDNLLRRINEKNTKEHIFLDAYSKYKSKYVETSLSLKEKLGMLFKSITKDNVKGIDIINYQKELFNRMFANNSHMQISFIVTDTDDVYTVVNVCDQMKNTYYVIDNIEKKVSERSLSEIEQLKMIDVEERRMRPC